MLRIFGHHVRISTIILVLTEFVLACGLLYAALHITYSGYGLAGLGVLEHLPLFVPAVVFSVLIYSFGAYEPSLQNNLRMIVRILIIAMIVGCVVSYIYLYLYGSEISVTRTILLSCVSFGLALLIVRGSIVLFAVNDLKPRILILGTGQRATELQQLISGSDRVVLHGYLPPQDVSGMAQNLIPEALVLRDFTPLSEKALAAGISEIIVALDDRRRVLPTADLLDCRMNGIKVTESVSFWERELGKVDLESLYPSWMIFSDGFRYHRITRIVKRLMDLSVSLVLLVVLAPVAVLVAAAVRLESQGPSLFKQERVGLHGKSFTLLKFRSMYTDAEKNGPRWAERQDRRITRVGRIIRKSRLDEIPQLINILKNDMSLVGPRPERPFFVKNLDIEIPYYSQRHKVKPGLTGWAQINYPYGASLEDAREKLKYDLYYVKNMSIFLDIMIIMRTLRVLAFTDGAR